MIELGRRAAACKHWRWLPGMQPLTLDDEEDWMPCDRVWMTQGGKPSPPEGAMPDLTDPATLGCLLALVREALDDSRIHCRTRANKFRVYSGVTPIGEWANSEGAALVAALEAAK